MTKIVLLNGPPGSGKDTAAKFICDELHQFGVTHVKLSEPLKVLASKIMMHEREFLEENKDTFTVNGMNFRTTQIEIFNAIATSIDRGWLGKYLYSTIDATEEDMFVCSDAGRMEDVEPLIENLGPDNICIIQLQRDGCTFEGDIRSYISFSGVETHVVNNTNIMRFQRETFYIASDFFAS